MKVAILNNIWFRYDETSEWVLEDLSLSIEEGERVCLVGDNGAGKSTLAKIVAGLVCPDFGDVELMGNKCFKQTKRYETHNSNEISNGSEMSDFGVDAEGYKQARKHIACVFQDPSDQMITDTVASDIAFGPRNLQLSENKIDDAVFTQLEKSGLSHLAGADPSTLSGGEQQLVALASAIAMQPKLLVLDEPSAYLDEENSHHFARLLEKIADDVAILHVTHKKSETMQADQIIELKKACLKL